MTTLYGSAQQTSYLPAEPQLDNTYLPFIPIFPLAQPVNYPQTLPAQWPPPGFFKNDPAQNSVYTPAYPAIPENPPKDSDQLEAERQQIASQNNGGPSPLLWLVVLGAAAYYLHKKGGF